LVENAFEPILAFLVLVIAFLYASVGFGGATGYLAVMSLFDIPANMAASTALTLNVIVAGIGFANFSRYGHLQRRLLWPFVITSIPAAFLGGTFQLNQVAYQMLLNVVLFYVAMRLIFSKSKARSEETVTPPPWPIALVVGALLGLISGMLGVGGGIFLSPLILLAGWGTPKQAAASAAGFILLNSLSGLGGRAWSGTLDLGSFGPVFILLGVAGGLSGSYMGAKYLSGRAIRTLLGFILLIAVSRFILVWLG
jgi:uncharacterized protein